MLQNNVIQITTAKLVGATLLPSSVLLISGVIIWRVWRNKQNSLQAETNLLNDELRQMKEQMADIQKTTAQTSPSSVAPPSPKQSKNPGKSSSDIGLFEFLIEDNVQMRQ